MNRTNQRQGALSTAAFATLPARSRLASWSHALAAALVAGSSLVSASLLPGSWESRATDQVNQLLRVFNRLVRHKAGDRELQAAELDRRVRVFCSGRQPSELRPSGCTPLRALADSSSERG